MDVENLKNIEIDRCSRCGCMWFDQDELRQAKDQTDPDLNWMDFEIWKHENRFRFEARSLKCPRCNINMVTIGYGETGIEIDYCPQCQGTWLDEGVFAKIIDALRTEIGTKSVSDYIKASLDEAKDIITGSEGLISEWKDFTTVLRMFQYRFFLEHPKLLDTVISIQKANPIR